MKKIILIFLLSFISILAQVDGVWKNYTSMREIIDIATSENKIWAASSGGVFSYDFATGEYQTLTKSEGLNSQNITCIRVDNEGNVLIGSQEGYIDVYNPSTKSVIHITDIVKTDHPSKRINDIKISGDSVYIATDFGVSLLNASTRLFIESYNKFGDFSTNSNVFSITIDTKIKVITPEGIATLDRNSGNPSLPQAWETIDLASPRTFNYNSSLLKFNNNEYIINDYGVSRFSDNTISDFFIQRETPFYDLYIRNDSLYIINNRMIYTSDGTDINLSYEFDDLEFSSMLTINGDDYVLSDNGITTFPITDNNIFLAPAGPAGNSFADMTVDNNGNLWAVRGRAASYNGIYKFDGTTWTNFEANLIDSLNFNSFHQIYNDKKGGIYFSNWGSGFSSYIDGSFRSYTAYNSPLTGIVDNPNFLVVWNVAKDSEDNVWVLNFEAADQNVLSVRTTDSTWYEYSLNSPFNSSVVDAQYFAIDEYDTKWFSLTDFSSPGPGLFYFNENGTLDDISDDTWGSIKTSNGLVNNEVTDITIDQRGELWIGTQEGISIITNPQNPTSRISTVFPLRNQAITCIEVDALNRKWIGTTQGVFLVSSDGTNLIANYTIDNSTLPANLISSITVDYSTGMAYIGTDYGLTTLTTLSGEPVVSGDELDIFPNPYIVGESEYVYIDKLVKNTSVKVLTIDGRLITTFETEGGSMAKWNGKDTNGNNLSSGIYIIVAYDQEADNIQLGKLAVIRK